MKTIKVSKQITIDIPDNQLIELCIETLKKVYNIPKDAYIDGENLVEWWDTHGSGYTEWVRKATKKDTIILGIIEELRGKL